MEDSEQAINQQLEKLERLMASLEINEQSFQVQEKEPSEASEQNEIIYDFSSEEDTDEPNFVGAETSGTKRDAEPMSENIFRDPTHTRIKYQKVPKYYEPKNNPVTGTGILNIDCVEDMGNTLREWYNINSILVQLNEDLKNLSSPSIFNYLICKTVGTAFKFLSDLPSEVMSTLPDGPGNVAAWMFELLNKEFRGWQDTPVSKLAHSQAQLWKITKLEICNMCYLDNFICEFRDIYYSIEYVDREKYKLDELFFRKLPESVSTLVNEVFTSEVEKGKIENNLGGRIATLKKWIAEQCLKKTAKREARISLCCSNQREKVGQYGCNTKKRRIVRKKRRFRKISSGRYRRNKKEKPTRFFKKKNIPRKKTCPKGKKTCTCWLCHEEGHYANECPKKDSQKKQVLNSIYELGFEPIESEADSDYSIYEYYTESDEEDTW